jgi:hypothetical protein
MSVSNAVASVGAEIMNTRVEIPAIETPITELIRVSLRARSSAWALSCAYDAEGIHSSRMLTGKSQMLGAKRAAIKILSLPFSFWLSSTRRSFRFVEVLQW